MTQVASRKLNDKEQLIEISWKDANGNNIKDHLSKVEIEYEQDGVTPKKQTYYWDDNKSFAYQTYDKDKGEWSDIKYTETSYPKNNNYNYNYSNSTSNWQSNWYDLARNCPMELEDGVMMQSVSVSSSSVSITLRLTNVSMYELSSSDKDALNSFKNNYRAYFKEYVPSNVSVYIYLQDKAGRSI